MNRDFKGIWIPKEIYLNEDLNWTEKILLIEIDSLDNEKGCYASNKYFAEFIGKSKNWVSQCISKLKDEGYIYQEKFDGRERILRSNLKYQIQSKAGFEKNQRGGLRKLKGGEHSRNNGQHEGNGKKKASNNTLNNIKTEEEEANFISKISRKFQQIYNRQLSVEFYQQIINIYSDPEIILKALSVAEMNSDKPAYLLKILQDWHENGLKAVEAINTYLDNRQAQNSLKTANKQTSTTQSMDDLYKNGYR